MEIKLQGYELQEAIEEYLQKELQTKGMVHCTELTTNKNIKKDSSNLIDYNEFEYSVFIEVE